MSSDSEKQQELDPSIYQYDELYDQIKSAQPSSIKQLYKDSSLGNLQCYQNRQRSRQKKNLTSKPVVSKYIKKMKQIVNERQKAHQYAYEKKILIQNQRLGVKPEEVFVTESYLKKKLQQKQKQHKQKEKQKYDQEHSILNKKKNVHDFTRRLLEQRSRKH